MSLTKTSLVGFLTLVMVGCGSGVPADTSAPASAAASTPVQASDGQLSAKEIISVPLSQNTVETVAFSPDGKHVAIGAADGTVAVYPLEPTDVNDVPRFQKIHATFVTSLAWAPTGNQVLSAATDGSVRVWDANTFAVSQRFNADPVTHPAAVWSPDGQNVALAQGRDSIEIWPTSGQTGPTDTFSLPGITQALLWSPGTDVIVASNDQGQVAFFQRGSSNPIRTYKPEASHKAVSSLSLSPTASLLAVGYEDGSIILLDPSTAKPVREFPKGQNIGSLAWAPNGKVLAATSMEFAVTFWDPMGSKLSKIDIGYDMNGVSWSPDGRYVASGSDDHTLKVWAISPPQTPERLTGTAPSYMRR